MEKKPFIEAGRIVNTHGVRGEVKIEVWPAKARPMWWWPWAETER